ncbi:MAG: DUF4157 domain-containing protein [Allosphingosinicella sp.]
MKARLRLAPDKGARRVGARAAQMPHKALMIARFGQRAAHVPVFTGPDVSEALRRRQSDAAALDGAIFLPDREVSSDLVAHELVHALQQGPAKIAETSAEALLARLDHAPALPAQSPAEIEARGAGPGPVEAPSQSLPAGMVALRRTNETGTLDRAPTPPAPAPPAAAPPAPAAESGAAAPGAEARGSESAAPEIAPTFSLPEPPATTLDPAVAAQRAAEAQAAEAALAAAATPSAVVDAYAGMAPSVKARNMAVLGTRIDEANTRSTAELAASTPAVEVSVSGSDAAIPAPPPIALPSSSAALETPAAEVPPVEVPAGPDQPVLTTDPTYGSRIERQFASGAQPEQIDEGIDAVSTSNPGVETRVADRADIPLEGANDPARMDEEATTRRGEAGAARGEAAQAVVDGPGPEHAVPRAIEQSAPAPEMPARPLTPLAAAPEAEQMQQLALPEEVVAGFDSATGAQMAATANATRDEMANAETQRDTEHQAALQQAETDRAAAESQADADQRREVGTRREAIQAERQRTVDQQAAAVEDVNGQAETARRTNREQADTQIASDRASINAEYDQAERDSAAEVSRGEREAEAERERKRRESEDQSWWERAVGFIKAAFEALTALVTAIFNAVRSAVTAIIDLARRAVTGLIALAARALQALVSAFGELLKGLVDHLLGAIFPELAAALTAFIDEAVGLLNRAIDVVATALTAAVNAIASALTAACNRLLDAFQGAINAALALAQAALTGDWSGFLRQVLDAVLRLLGIDPAAFNALIAQASDAISIIVNDPMHFVGNLVEAFVGGVRLFSEHFLTHLRRGIIGWLTGALGDIQLPSEWNIWSVLDLIRQVLGLTWDFLRERAARVIGRENVARLEMIGSWIATLITEGWAGLWHRLQDQLESLKDTVLNAIKSFILERVIMASITWLASLFNPVGAIVQLVMTIWNLYQFVRNQMQRLMGIAQAVVAMISNIAHDVLDPAKQRVEEVLGSLVPVVIDLLMSLLGVTGVASRVREIIAEVRQSIANAADRLIERTLVALGLRQAAPAAGGASAAPDGAGQIGHPVTIDVAQGEDHTLRIDRTGAGGATVMLCTAPRPLADWLTTLSTMADRETDAAKQTSARNDITAARGILARLDPIADRAAAATAPPAAAGAPAAPAPATADAAEVGRAEDELGPVLTRIFNALAGATSAFADQYRAEIEHAHPQAQAMIRQELRDHAGEWVRLTGWPAVSGAMTAASPLFTDPLDGARTFGDLARRALSATIVAEHRPLEARILTLVRQKVRDGAADAEYATLKTQLQQAILTNSLGSTTAAMTAAAAKAAAELSASTDVDPDLRAAIGSDLNRFLIAMAKGQTVGTITPARFDQLWGAPGGANKDFVASRFRSPQGLHEWIPTNYIPNVLAAARAAPHEEGIEYAALWVNVHDVWRTTTEVLIFKPDTGWKRDVTITTPSATPGGAPTVQHAVVPQGHVGAIYAKADDQGVCAAPQQQTIGQGPWHDRLRAIFDANTAVPSESKAALGRVIDQIQAYATSTLWTGSAFSGLNASVFDEYYDSGRATKIGVAGITSAATSSIALLQQDFAAARGVIR